MLRAWIDAGTDRVDLMGTLVDEPVTDLETMLVGLEAAIRADERAKYEALEAALREIDAHKYDDRLPHGAVLQGIATRALDKFDALHQQGGQ